jgi:hypothetical protein
MARVIRMDQVTEGKKVVGKKFTIKADPNQPFEIGETYPFDYSGPKGEWVLKCKCLVYLEDLNEYRFQVVKAEKQ